ncbi:hypothetical protein [Shinella fusca]|uniref:Uncharacterized protein n=1 Tax=Shinella fusca TaxID=544480 RepID=A0A7W8DTG2_9HYPH|nr:hypothetical protein [Shinella fusca]MBB5041914.1 hypothetical protein [Shinella fusca]
MRQRFNIIGMCLLAIFIVLFGSIIAMPLLSDTPSGPLEINVDAVAATGDGGDTQ